MDPTILYKISYGLYVISSINNDNKFNGQIANTLIQVTSQPAQVTVTLHKENLTHKYIMESNVFSASILSQATDMEFIGKFGFKTGHNIDKFNDIEYMTGKTGTPIVLANTIAYLDAKVIGKLDVGTHTIFLGKVENTGMVSDHEAMTYAYYHQIKGGKSPKNAPTYIDDKILVDSKGGETHKCKICGYIYDPKNGDQSHQIIPGTSFEDLADDWRCPLCRARKQEFVWYWINSSIYKNEIKTWKKP